MNISKKRMKNQVLQKSQGKEFFENDDLRKHQRKLFLYGLKSASSNVLSARSLPERSGEVLVLIMRSTEKILPKG